MIHDQRQGLIGFSQVGGREYANDTRHGQGGGSIYRADASVAVRTPQDGSLHTAERVNIGRVLAPAAQKTRIFEAPNRGADPAVRAMSQSLVTHPRKFRSLAV